MRKSVMLLSLLLFLSGAAQAQIILPFDITFSELPSYTQVPLFGDSMNVQNVLFNFEPNGAVEDAFYNAAGPGTSMTYVEEPGLVGPSQGILTLRFKYPADELQFGVALDVQSGGIMPGFNVQLFDPTMMDLGTFPTDATLVDPFAEGLFRMSDVLPPGTQVSMAVVTFDTAFATSFELDNLLGRELAPEGPPPAPIPEPGVLSTLASGILAFPFARRRGWRLGKT